MSQAKDGLSDTIVSIELYWISLPFDAARRSQEDSNAESIDAFNASSRTLTQMESLMVKVHTADGFTGWGEAFGHKSNPATWAALEQIVAPFFLGRSSALDGSIASAEYAFHAFGRTGPIHFALSAVDIALWDIAARRAGQTLREFINIDSRHEINAYASLVHYAEDPQEVAFHLSRALEHGFKAFKIHESSIPAIKAARQAVGSHPLMVDVNCKWHHPAEAGSSIAAMADLELLWIEEPIFPPDDSQSLAALNARFGNVSGGENHSGVQGLTSDMELGALQFAQPSVGKIGGLSAMLKIREAGQRLNVHVVPHCFYYGPALLATAQLIAADQEVQLANGSLRPELEIPFLGWETQLHPWHAPHQGKLTNEGTIRLPTEAGLGFTPDPVVLENHALKHLVLTTAPCEG
ncbi:mandelate racemase/muconate lactonizing enzyme family protein [Micrococcus antarcticus]|uniref:mandelate racemase/muconate lactonizing enzyme family protein n=1 Tax=Glutamicibacter sp. NPDC087673 TaxID=3363997 RepID=UPI003631D2A5